MLTDDSTLEIEKWLNVNVGNENYTPGLSRVKDALALFELRPNAQIITVAGTNGKGSVCRSLAFSLSKAYNVVLFTSPHLISLCERFWHNQTNISSAKLFHLLQETWSICLNEKILLTHFELLFVTFMRWQKAIAPDYIILEVGLGGRFDATNAVEPTITVITSISRDHQEILGNRYDLILIEKLGITRPGTPVITGHELKYLRDLTEGYCQLKDIPHRAIAHDKNFKRLNQKIVQTVLKELAVDVPVIFPETTQLKSPLLNQDVTFFGSHNPDAVRKLVHFLRQEHYNNSIKTFDLLVLSFSKRSEKDLMTMVKQFLTLRPAIVKQIVLTCFEHPKAANAQVIAEIAKLNGISFVKDFKKHCIPAHKILVSGSNYFYRPFYSALSGSID
jgi:dihydrofolate synthase / folylpolyglutamate synthase